MIVRAVTPAECAAMAASLLTADVAVTIYDGELDQLDLTKDNNRGAFFAVWALAVRELAEALDVELNQTPAEAKAASQKLEVPK